ncbi:MAG: hypothetical protein ABW133_16320 [Polyangiaceae bacterium]
MSLREFAGEPFVLVLFAREGAARAAEIPLATLHAEMRGLGAALLVISPDGVWRFRPDEGLDRIAREDELCHVELAGVLADYGLTTDEEERGPDRAVYVVDHDLRVVFERRFGPDDEAMDLALVLDASRRALVARPRAMALSPRVAVGARWVTT